MTDRPRSRLPIYLAFVAFISLGLPDTVLGVAWPSMRAAFGQPFSRIGWLLLGNMAGYLTSSFFAGQVVRSLGVGRLLAVSGLLVTLALLGTAGSPFWPPLIALAMVGGLGAGAIDAGINAYAASRFSPRIVNWLHACFGIGATAGPLLMTTVLDLQLSWRLGYAILTAALAGLSIVLARTSAQWEMPDSSSVTEPDLASLDEAWRRPLLWAHALLFFVYCGIESTASQLLYSVFRESRGLDVARSGGTIAGYWASLTAGRLIFGQLAHFVKPMTILRITTITVPVAAALISWSPAPGVGLAATWLLGFSLAPIFPTLISLTPQRVGVRFAAQAIGFQVSAAALGIAVFPAGVAALVRPFGLEIIPLELAAAGLMLLVLHEALQPFLNPKLELTVSA